VACKIHQINKTWKDQIRSNYVKHAIRENTVLKQLNHINIISHYDSVEIDDEAFGTILEYCEGLDLGSYLKRHKLIPEKEAKMIIK
jgi:tousled-like kinase